MELEEKIGLNPTSKRGRLHPHLLWGSLLTRASGFGESWIHVNQKSRPKTSKARNSAWKSSLLSTKRSTSKVYGVEEPASYRYTWITISVKPGPSVYIDIFTVYSFPFSFIFLSKIASGCTSYSPSFPTIGMSDRTCTPSPTLFFNCETLKTGCTSVPAFKLSY